MASGAATYTSVLPGTRVPLTRTQLSNSHSAAALQSCLRLAASAVAFSRRLLFLSLAAASRLLSLCLLQSCQSGVHVRQVFAQVIYALLAAASDTGQQKQNENSQNC